MAVALWCKSNFSFLEGASHPEELVGEAHRLGLQALALCDRDGVYGVVRAHVKALELGIQLIIGAQVSVEDGTLLLLLVSDGEGYANLCRLLSAGRLRSPKGESRVSFEEIAFHAPGLIALWGGENSRLLAEAAPDAEARLLKDAFGDRLYALFTRHLTAEEAPLEDRLLSRAGRYGLPLAAATEVLYHTPARRPLQDILTCLRHGVSLHTAGRRLKPNAEHALLSKKAFAERFEAWPQALANARAIAGRCCFSLAELRYRYPAERLESGLSASESLRHLVMAGASGRYGGAIPGEVTQQLEKELALIEKLDYGGYFLTMHEIVRFCHQQDILCQGRGSAANSAVCYCLGVTAVDPVRMGLLFERFISEERAEPPDIDLDIEHERREEVIQHVYQKYGRSHAAMVAVFITYRTRSAIRDVGKSLGVPETDLERLSKLARAHGGLSAEALKAAGCDPEAPLFKHLVTLSKELRDFPRHLSIHPGGFLLGHEPVSNLVPIENGTKADRTVIQWDKNDVEALGLFKVDLLGLGALNHIHRCFDLIKKHHHRDLTMATIPAEDPKTYAMLAQGDAVGVFQVESRAQMAMLPRLKPRNYYDLVIEISLVRPGPISGGMVHPYLRRRAGEEAIDYPHPALIPVLKKTLGIPLFQEQVMKLAMIAADYTPGEADQLRRDMGAWRKTGQMALHHERLVGRMQAKGISDDFAERIFKQIEGFGDYGFPEAHAASFALISYAGAWLKRHYPAAFTCALLNAQPMGFYAPATLLEDAKRHGIEFRAISIPESQWECTLEPRGSQFAIRMGLSLVSGLGAADGRAIASAVATGPFLGLDDFMQRCPLNEKTLGALAEAGAFERFGKSRRQALWETKAPRPLERPPLPVGAEPMPSFLPLSLFETIQWDYRQAGHSTRGHPLGPLRPLLLAQGLMSARAIAQQPNGSLVRYAGLVICRQRPATASGVTFMTLEDESGFLNLVVWPAIFERYARIARLESLLGVEGKLQIKEGTIHLIAQTFWRPAISLRPAPMNSRDFH